MARHCAGKSDAWEKGESFTCEKDAIQEYGWLCGHGSWKEFLLICLHEPIVLEDDELPWEDACYVH